MKITQLRHVVSVAQHGSVHATARHLGLAQPALTRSIRELERELGVALFERRAHGVELTEAGKRFVERAALALGEIQRAQEEVRQGEGASAGRVTACLSTVPHIAFLPHVLKPFRRRFPLVKLDVLEGMYPQVQNGIRSGGVDFFIGPMPQGPVSRDLVEERLFENELVVIARKGHPLAGAGRLRDLRDAHWMTTSVAERDELELFSLFETYRLGRPTIVMQAHSLLTVAISVANTDVLAIVPVQWPDFPMLRGQVQRIHIREKLPGAPFVLVHRAGLAMTPAAEFFCDLLRRQCPVRP